MSLEVEKYIGHNQTVGQSPRGLGPGCLWCLSFLSSTLKVGVSPPPLTSTFFSQGALPLSLPPHIHLSTRQAPPSRLVPPDC